MYRADGTRVANDDDDGIDNYSQLSFGDPTLTARPALTFAPFPDGLAADGQDNVLPAGTYYLAVTGFNAEFSNLNFVANSENLNTGTFFLQFRTDILPSASTGSSGNNAPAFKLVAKSIPSSTGDKSIKIRGTSTDADGGVPTVFVKVGSSKFAKAKGDLKWNFTADLKVGANTIKIYSVDTAGNRSKTRKLKVTRTP